LHPRPIEGLIWSFLPDRCCYAAFAHLSLRLSQKRKHVHPSIVYHFILHKSALVTSENKIQSAGIGSGTPATLMCRIKWFCANASAQMLYQQLKCKGFLSGTTDFSQHPPARVPVLHPFSPGSCVGPLRCDTLHLLYVCSYLYRGSVPFSAIPYTSPVGNYNIVLIKIILLYLLFIIYYFTKLPLSTITFTAMTEPKKMHMQGLLQADGACTRSYLHIPKFPNPCEGDTALLVTHRSFPEVKIESSFNLKRVNGRHVYTPQSADIFGLSTCSVPSMMVDTHGWTHPHSTHLMKQVWTSGLAYHLYERSMALSSPSIFLSPSSGLICVDVCVTGAWGHDSDRGECPLHQEAKNTAGLRNTDNHSRLYQHLRKMHNICNPKERTVIPTPSHMLDCALVVVADGDRCSWSDRAGDPSPKNVDSEARLKERQMSPPDPARRCQGGVSSNWQGGYPAAHMAALPMNGAFVKGGSEDT
ncbi:hypothetical protein JOB18_018787, partial [Solea senegalensis]